MLHYENLNIKSAIYKQRKGDCNVNMSLLFWDLSKGFPTNINIESKIIVVPFPTITRTVLLMVIPL